MALTSIEKTQLRKALRAQAPDTREQLEETLGGDDDAARAFITEFAADAVPKAQADRDNYLAQAASCDEFIALFE